MPRRPRTPEEKQRRRELYKLHPERYKKFTLTEEQREKKRARARERWQQNKDLYNARQREKRKLTGPGRPPAMPEEERKRRASERAKARRAKMTDADREKDRLRKIAAARAKGIMPPPPKMSDEERLSRRLARNRITYRRRRGLPDDYVFPSAKKERTPKIKKEKATPRPKTAKSTPEERAQRKLEAKRRYREKLAEAKKAKLDSVRAARAAEVAAAKTHAKPKAAPAPCADPPELVALFKKASKGAAPRAHNPKVRKLSVYHLRWGLTDD